MKKRFQIALLISIFFASGFSSLVYQVAWQRILTLYYSVENISTTLIVSVYMMGLGLGAILGGYLTERIKNKILYYFVIELLIGFFGYISLPFLEFIGTNTAGASYIVSFLCMFAFLGFPTILMGMTLPLLTKIFNGIVNNFLESLSYLYFINTLGAAVGAIITSYVFISLWGMDTSVYIAAAINILIAALVFIFRKKYETSAQTTDEPSVQETMVAGNQFSSNSLVYAIVFATGFIAIGYEIIWFRFIGTIVKASPYSFSSVLFVYLVGIALGSYLMKKRLSRNTTINRKNLFFTLQVAIALFVLIPIIIYCFLIKNVEAVSWLNAYSFSKVSHPLLFTKPESSSFSAIMLWVFGMTDIIIWPAIFAFIPTVLMGASFPLITSMAYRGDKAGDTVGRIYFFNVMGNVTGGLITGLVFLQYLGTEYTLLLFTFAGLLFVFFNGNGLYMAKPTAKIAFVAVTVVLSILLFPGRNQLYKTIHFKMIYDPKERIIVEEGVDGVIVTYAHNEYVTTFINGNGNGGRPAMGFYYEAMMAASYNKEIKNALVIGFGTGSTVEALLKLNPKPNITVVELSETTIKTLRQVDYLDSFLNDPNVHLIIADGRKFLNQSKDKFDAICMDPLIPTISFSNNLYSKEFFTLLRDHLTPQGVAMIWLGETNVIPKTICSAFPYVHQYSFFCIASPSEIHANATYRQELFGKFPAEYTKELNGIDSIHDKKDYPMDKAEILAYDAKYPINEDYKPRCEYYIGLNLLVRKIKHEKRNQGKH